MKNPLIQCVDIKAQAADLFPGIQIEMGPMLFQIKTVWKDWFIFSVDLSCIGFLNNKIAERVQFLWLKSDVSI